jgi:starch-binding outer membrane protein, SusD/RagB family
MKNIILYKKTIIAVLAVMLFVSCKKKLEEYNPGGVTADAVFNTPAGFEAGVSGVYSFNRWTWGKEAGYNLYEAGSDIWLSGVDDVNKEITSYTPNFLPTNAVVDQVWGKYYAAINLANALISRVGESGLSAALKMQREGELRMLRAWYYFFVVETWGPSQLTLEETKGIVTTAYRKPVDSIYTAIVNDMNIAIAQLPLTVNAASDNGRVTKPAAEAFLAKAYLTWASYDNNTARFDSAYKYANNVIMNYPAIRMLDKYSDLWDFTKQINTEVIWAVNYANDFVTSDSRTSSGAPGGTVIVFPDGHPRGSNNSHFMYIPKYDVQPGMTRSIGVYGQPFTRFMPSKFLLNLFDATMDGRYAATFTEAWISNKTTPTNNTITLSNGTTVTRVINPGDTALYITKDVLTNEFKDGRKYNCYDINRVYAADGMPRLNNLFVAVKKFIDPTKTVAPATQTTDARSARDAFVFRLADILLIAAEAKIRLNDPATAASLINKVRRRAAGGTYPFETPGVMDITPAQATLGFLLDERARELAGEQWRWMDLKRTGQLITRVKANNPQAGPTIQAFHTLRPIPQTQIDAVTNKEEFRQNQGYN